MDLSIGRYELILINGTRRRLLKARKEKYFCRQGNLFENSHSHCHEKKTTSKGETFILINFKVSRSRKTQSFVQLLKGGTFKLLWLSLDHGLQVDLYKRDLFVGLSWSLSPDQETSLRKVTINKFVLE